MESSRGRISHCEDQVKAVNSTGGDWPNRLITDKLRSYSAAHREVMPSVPHDTSRWANNLAEVTHEALRFRERQMRGFKPGGHA